MRGMANYARGPNSVPNATGLTGLDVSGTAYSLTFWLKPFGNAGTDSDFFLHADGTNGGLNGLWVGFTLAGSLQVANQGASSGTQSNSAAGLLDVGRWNHYAIVWTGAEHLFYRNGALKQRVANATAPTTSATRGTRIGGNDFNGFFLGQVFDLQLFPSRALKPGEIEALMDPRIQLGGCTGRYFRNWNGGASAAIPDESGNGNTLTGSSTFTRCDTCEPPPWRRLLRVRPRYIIRKPAAGTAFTQSLGGTVAGTGAAGKLAQLAKAGTSTSTGIPAKQAQAAKAGSVASSGAPAKQAQGAKAGTVTSAGTNTKAASKAAAGSSSPTGTPAKLASKSTAGTVTSSGVITAIKVVLKALGGTVGAAGSIAKACAKAVAGAVGGAGTPSKVTSKAAAGTVASSGAPAKQGQKAAAGTVIASGAVSRAILKALGGTVAGSGALARFIRWVLRGTVSSTGAITQSNGVPVVLGPRPIGISARSHSTSITARSSGTSITRR